MKIHIVQKGDTLWKIAQKYGVDFEQLKKINGHLSDPNLIMPGMKIKVPTAGVPVKKGAKTTASPKKIEVKEHPYTEAKPFVSIDLEAEFGSAPNAAIGEAPAANQTPAAANPTNNMSVAPKPANEMPTAPKAANETPAPAKAANNTPAAPKMVNELPTAPKMANELPTAPKMANELPTAPKAANNTPAAPVDKAKQAANEANAGAKTGSSMPIGQAPNAKANQAAAAPVNELPNVPVNEAPAAVNEAPAPKQADKAANPAAAEPVEEKKETAKAEAKASTPPLVHTIPPVTPPPPLSFAQSWAAAPPLPPKPSNILPDVMKEENGESPNEWKAEESDEAPPLPHLPNAPFVPPTFGANQGYVSTVPVWPGAGYYTPPLPTAPPIPHSSPAAADSPESSSAPFPGIQESSDESAALPPVGHGAPPFPSPIGAGYVHPAPMAPVYGAPATYAPPSGYPPLGYMPIYAPAPYYGGYIPSAPHGYALPPTAPVLQWPGGGYPANPPGSAPPFWPAEAGPRLFGEPPDEESEHGDNE
ncbi:SafA/ExsA family spore coat assembly protein [Geobacillus subterraneus]|uniref:LysM domain-containing protein n=1 Tax=Geobacillus subterraneus TaxID=129338 RepID=A0A679FIH5_9BACL|nr:SafA/ExsA family spore coat assembly protein [Geobacillus subterraneus]BBW95440.1 hypothetical protein GsuE55_02730 [Geobacillus subterraneus]